ncbi:hypothetical protein VTN96DRAFT_5294 [Rasamsonia emersonii]|uniref:F-box domain-containing protein n=1 Tax=Rasamsonia emersonii (strain ATCC 16479 / CBS 393.64 / IMI 116815) TaxID=1408163 RepID=A0A0F4YY93_RASE3|nr:hypothetical protein T310_2787 [Rasamsonia emersonii CBS 393.64]KKA23194.1 hypothetical protein T310_2787 [Rasamsonia emersonii CBS 393.64]
MAPSLTTLPRELLWEVLDHLDSLLELHSLLLTCKYLYQSCDGAPRKIVSAIVSRSDQLELPQLEPYPHLLLAASARRLADWAIQNDKRRKQLKLALHGGIWSLFELAMEKVPIGLDEIREIWRWKEDVLEPITRDLDECCGPEAQKQLLDDSPICDTPQLSLLLWVIYGELFHHTFSFVCDNHQHLYHDAPPPLEPLDCFTRFKFLVYCVPDFECFEQLGIEHQNLHPRVQRYMNDPASTIRQQGSMEVACENYLHPDQWADALGLGVTICADPRDLFRYSENIEELLYISTVMHWGKRSLEVLLPSRAAKYAAELEHLRSKIEDVVTCDATFLRKFPRLPRDILEWTKDTRDQLNISPWVLLAGDLRLTLQGWFASDEEWLRYLQKMGTAGVENFDDLSEGKEFNRLVAEIRTPPEDDEDEEA